MRGWQQFTCVVIGLILLSQGAFASSIDQKKENSTYHDQKYPTLAERDIYKKYDFSVVILHIAAETSDPSLPGGMNTTVWKSVYFPRVDMFTELRSHFTQPLVEKGNTTVRVWLEFPAFNMRSESRIMLIRYNDSYDKIDLLVGMRAITVKMEEGKMTDIFWDDTCAGCSADKCIEDSCSSVIADLRPTCTDKDQLKKDPYHCGLKIYLAWTGTDREGMALSSYGSLPSRFQKYSFIASAYDAASGFATDFVTFWKQPMN